MSNNDAPSLRESATFGPSEPAVLACLVAAKSNGIVSRYARGMCKTSGHPDHGWWAAGNWGGASMALGGPWSVEFIHRMCELGLISLNPQDGSRGSVTKAGRALLRERLGKASTGTRKDGSSPLNPPTPVTLNE